MIQSSPRVGAMPQSKLPYIPWRQNVIPAQWVARRPLVATSSLTEQTSTSGDLQNIIQQLLRNKRKLLLATLASLLVGLTYLSLATPLYTSTASLFVDPRSRKIEEAVQSGIGGDTTLLETQIAIITSDGVLRRVAEKLNLANNREFTNEEKNPLGGLTAIFLRGTMPMTSAEKALAYLRKAVKVNRVLKTYAFDITATASSPSGAAELAQAVLDAYFADQTEAKSAEAKRANELLDSRLGALRELVQQAETRADEYRKANKILSSEGAIVNEQQLTKLSTELISTRAVAAEAKAKRDQIQIAIKSGAEPDVLGDAARSGLIGKLREQYSQVARREASLATQLQPGHPLMIDVRSQLNAVKTQINAELKRVATAAESEYQVAANREKEVSSQIEKARQEVGTVNTAQIHLRDLEQDVAGSRELFKKFLDGAKETQQQQTISTPDARVISQPVAPSAPSKPVPWLVMALSLLTGLGTGAAWALKGEKTTTALKSLDQFARLTGLSAVSAIPELKSGSSSLRGQALPYGVQFSDMLSALGSKLARHAAYNQSVLRLLSRIKAQGRAGRPNTVLFGSPRSGAGNSAAVLAVAYSAAMSGERVLLVDSTSINPELSSVFAANLPQSTTVILDSKDHLNKIITRDARSNLSFLPIALADLRTLKTQQRRRLVAGLNAVSQDYDWIFIDAGALLEDEAATILLPATTQVYLVARSGSTDAADIDETLAILEPVRDRIAGGILTCAPSPDRT
jgi:polysaccharide biosynthesis transport protein